jgi:hypothetical protein
VDSTYTAPYYSASASTFAINSVEAIFTGAIYGWWQL